MRPPTTFVAVAILCLSQLVVASLASAQSDDEAAESDEEAASDTRDAQGRRLFTDGVLAFEEERFADALEYFRAAHRLTGRAELLYNVGLSAERAGLRDEARETFQAYLLAEPDADNAEEVRARLVILANDPEAEPADDGSSPWLWVGIGAGVLVVVGVVLAIVLATSGSSVQGPLAGDVGPDGVVYALSGGW